MFTHLIISLFKVDCCWTVWNIKAKRSTWENGGCLNQEEKVMMSFFFNSSESLGTGSRRDSKISTTIFPLSSPFISSNANEAIRKMRKMGKKIMQIAFPSSRYFFFALKLDRENFFQPCQARTTWLGNARRSRQDDSDEDFPLFIRDWIVYSVDHHKFNLNWNIKNQIIMMMTMEICGESCEIVWKRDWMMSWNVLRFEILPLWRMEKFEIFLHVR